MRWLLVDGRGPKASKWISNEHSLPVAIWETENRIWWTSHWHRIPIFASTQEILPILNCTSWQRSGLMEACIPRIEYVFAHWSKFGRDRSSLPHKISRLFYKTQWQIYGSRGEWSIYLMSTEFKLENTTCKIWWSHIWQFLLCSVELFCSSAPKIRVKASVCKTRTA